MVCHGIRRIFGYVALLCASLFGAATPMEAQSAQATLSWDYTASGAVGFVLYCGSASRSYSIRVDVGNTTTYTLGGLTAEATYYCATTAYDAGKSESTFSSEVTFSTPVAPPASGLPQVTAHTPLTSAIDASIGTTVTATFSEPVQQSTVVFTLAGPAGALVPATVTYDATSFTVALQPSAPLAPSTTYTANITGAKDVTGMAMAAPVTWTFTTSASQTGCPCTIWPASATPAQVAAEDTSAIELGVKIRSNLNGMITGIRFYKSTTNTGTHVANLWTAAGTLLASATFKDETGSGWQQVSFSAPVPITADADYVASYHTNAGHYSVDIGYFSAQGVDRGPLHALPDGGRGNGVYKRGTSSLFPNETYRSANFWVDVVFKAP